MTIVDKETIRKQKIQKSLLVGIIHSVNQGLAKTNSRQTKVNLILNKEVLRIYAVFYYPPMHSNHYQVNDAVHERICRDIGCTKQNLEKYMNQQGLSLLSSKKEDLPENLKFNDFVQAYGFRS